MNKIFVITALVIFSLFSIANSNIVFAVTFQTEAEIDAYYDAQLKQLDEETNRKIQENNDQLQRDLDNTSKVRDAEIWAIYKEVYGKDFEMVKPFLPESNPDPAEHAKNILMMPRESALKAIRNIKATNLDLGNKVEVIYEREYLKLNQTIPTVTQPVASSTKKVTPPTPEVLFEYLDSWDNRFRAAYTFEQVKVDNLDLYLKVAELARLRYFKDQMSTVDYFNYLDSLSASEAEFLDGKLGIFSPRLQKDVRDMAWIKYPKGKPDTLAELAQTKKTTLPNIISPVNNKVEVKNDNAGLLKKSSTTTISATTSSTTLVATSTATTTTPEPKRSWFGRLWKFFFR